MKYLYYMIFVGLTLAISTFILHLTVNNGFVNVASSSMLMMIFVRMVRFYLSMLKRLNLMFLLVSL